MEIANVGRNDDDGRHGIERVPIEHDVLIGIAEVPGEVVHVAEDVAACAARLAIAAGQVRVVEERTAGDHVVRLGVGERNTLGLGLRCGLDHAQRIIEARRHVELVSVHEHARGATAADSDVIAGKDGEGVGFEARHVVDADPSGAEARNVDRVAVGREGHAEGRRETAVLDARRDRDGSVGDVLVQVARRDGRSDGVEDRDPRLSEIAAHRCRLTDRLQRVVRDVIARPFESHVVLGIGVRHEELAGGRMHGHVEERGADPDEGRPDLGRRDRVRVDREHVLVGQLELHEVAPIAAQLVLPSTRDTAIAVLLDDQPVGLHGVPSVILEGRRQTARRGLRAGATADRTGPAHGLVEHFGRCRVADHGLVERHGPVARAEDRDVDAITRDVSRERARSVAEDGHDREAVAFEGVAEVRCVEDVDVGAPKAGGVEVAVDDGAVLSAVGCRDKGPVATGSREHDVVRLVADEQGAHDARSAAHVDDAHAVREVVHDPDLIVVTRGDGDGFEADPDAPGRREIAVGVDVEEINVTVGRVHDEELLPVRRQRHRPDRPALEELIRALSGREASRQDDRGEGQDGGSR